MAFQFRIYYKIFLKQFRSKEIGAVEPTTRHALHMEAHGKGAYGGKPADAGAKGMSTRPPLPPPATPVGRGDKL